MDEETKEQERTNMTNKFCSKTSCSREEAYFRLESSNWNYDAALSSYYYHNIPGAPSRDPLQQRSEELRLSPSTMHPLRRSRSLTSHYSDSSLFELDFQSNLDDETSPDDDTSAMPVQDSSNLDEVDTSFQEEEPEIYRVPPNSPLEVITETTAKRVPEVVLPRIQFWRNGFSVDDGPFRSLDDPANSSFVESVKNFELPEELDQRTSIDLMLKWNKGNYTEPKKRFTPFQGVGRILSSSSSVMEPFNTTAPLFGVVVDENLPSTSVQIRLADGTRIVSRFNYHHTVTDVREFIDWNSPCGLKKYQLLIMGFPLMKLTDPSQTIEQAGLARAVVIQKY